MRTTVARTHGGSPRTLRIAVGGAIIALSLSACGSGSISTDELEKQISAQLAAQVGQEPDSVDCPDSLDAEVGATERCTLSAGGDSYGVDVEVTKVEGSTASFNIKVDEQPTE